MTVQRFADMTQGVRSLSDSNGTPSGLPENAAAASTGEPPVLQRPDDGPSEQPWQTVSPASVTVERIASWVFTLVISVVGAMVVVSILLANWPLDWLGWVLIAGYGMAVLALMVASHLLPPIAYRHTRYRLSDVGFEIRRGIFWRSSIIVPHNRVQHTDVAQGPLQRSFDLGKLIIYTAGTQNASVELNGLAFQTASELRDALVGRLEGTDGV